MDRARERAKEKETKRRRTAGRAEGHLICVSCSDHPASLFISMAGKSNVSPCTIPGAIFLFLAANSTPTHTAALAPAEEKERKGTIEEKRGATMPSGGRGLSKELQPRMATGPAAAARSYCRATAGRESRSYGRVRSDERAGIRFIGRLSSIDSYPFVMIDQLFISSEKLTFTYFPISRREIVNIIYFCKD